MKRPTLYDVAREAGVSHMTVSRVVRGSRSVREGTARRVREALRKLDYRPDPALSALASYRSREGGGQGSVLAFLDCDQTLFSGIVLDGIRREAGHHGYTVDRFVLARTPSSQRTLARMLYHRGVRGLIFGPSDDLWNFSGWDWNEYAAVSLGAVSHQPALHSVAMDYFHGAVTACRWLEDQGCRRVGLVVDPKLEARSGHRWLGGYLAARSYPGSAAVYRSVVGDAQKLRAWVRREKVDGILTIHGEVWKNLRERPVRFAFLNDSVPHPELPCLVLNPEDIGAEGLRLLHHLLLRREFGLPGEPKMVALRGKWREGFLGSA